MEKRLYVCLYAQVENSLYIYLELVSGGSIYKLLHEFEGKFPEPIIRRYTRQILLGLEYLHDKKTVHRYFVWNPIHIIVSIVRKQNIYSKYSSSMGFAKEMIY